MWGFTGILGKLIDLEPLYIVWWRVLIAFVGLAIALKVMKKSLQIPSGKRLLQIIGVGIIGISGDCRTNSISIVKNPALVISEIALIL